MVDSLNKVILIGNVGDDPKPIKLDSGKRLVSFSLATSSSWNGANGERQSHTDWHRIVVYSDGLVNIIEKLGIKKGSKLFIEGKLVTRKWVDKDEKNRLTVEVVLQGYNCSLIALSSSQYPRKQDDFDIAYGKAAAATNSKLNFGNDLLDDDFEGFLDNPSSSHFED